MSVSVIVLYCNAAPHSQLPLIPEKIRADDRQVYKISRQDEYANSLRVLCTVCECVFFSLHFLLSLCCVAFTLLLCSSLRWIQRRRWHLHNYILDKTSKNIGLLQVWIKPHWIYWYGLHYITASGDLSTQSIATEWIKCATIFPNGFFGQDFREPFFATLFCLFVGAVAAAPVVMCARDKGGELEALRTVDIVSTGEWESCKQIAILKFMTLCTSLTTISLISYFWIRYHSINKWEIMVNV